MKHDDLWYRNRAFRKTNQSQKTKQYLYDG
jgi:hypothetical protein